VSTGHPCEKYFRSNHQNPIDRLGFSLYNLTIKNILAGVEMEINMMQHQNPFSLPRTRVAVLPASQPVPCCACETPRPARLARAAVRAGGAFLAWLNRLGARPVDPEALEKMHYQHASLRIKGIGH
jgi:hypothetical protein